MRTRFYKHGSSRSGMAVMELAIAFPVLMFIGMGAIEFGEFFYTKSAFESAARDAARVSMMTTAKTADPATAASTTLLAAGITFNSSWMTIIDVSSFTTVTDVSQIPAGHVFTVIIQIPYDQIPGRYRPLYQMTGQGIQNGKPVLGQSTMVKA